MRVGEKLPLSFSHDKEPPRVWQYGRDGAGHQLHGIFSLTALHFTKNAILAVPPEWERQFAHLDNKEAKIVRNYFNKGLNRLAKELQLNKLNKSKYL